MMASCWLSLAINAVLSARSSFLLAGKTPVAFDLTSLANSVNFSPNKDDTLSVGE